MNKVLRKKIFGTPFQEICEKTTTRDREEFDVKEQRISGTVASEYKVKQGNAFRAYRNMSTFSFLKKKHTGK